MTKIALTVTLLSALSQFAFAGPIHVGGTRSSNSTVARVLNTDFPDPCVLKTDKGYYSFATSGNGAHIQVATSKDFKEWKRMDHHDAIPGPFPDWIAEKPSTWAPDVIKRVCYPSSNT